MDQLSLAFQPNAKLSKRATMVIVLGWLAFTALLWQLAPHPIEHPLPGQTSGFLPSPGQTLDAMQTQWNQGIVFEIISSMTVYLQALFYTTVITLSVAYVSVVPIFRPAANSGTYIRFISMIGLTFAFMLIFGGGHGLKVALLTFGMTAFALTDMRKVVRAIPLEQYDHARTLGMKPWRVVWEVVVRGTLEQSFDTIRTNAAMGWMMLPMVESFARSEGGVGVVLLGLQRGGAYAPILGIQIILFTLGIGQDYLLGILKNTTCPYARLGKESS